MTQNQRNQAAHPHSIHQGGRVDLDENIGAQRRADGGPDTDFDMDSGGEERDTGAAQSGAVPGAIYDRATTGALGSGPINTGTGTGGGSQSPNTSGVADITGQTTAGAGDWSRAGSPGLDPTQGQSGEDLHNPNTDTQSDERLSGETGIAHPEATERNKPH
jgi:hypothetical protein